MPTSSTSRSAPARAWCQRGAAAGPGSGPRPRDVAPDGGLPYLMRPFVGFRGPRNPVPGLDVAGVVAAVGADGDAVRGRRRGLRLRQGHVRGVRRRAARTSWPRSRRTSPSSRQPWSRCRQPPPSQALTQVADVQPGQQVLVIGASGGVGSYAVQLAKALGAEVTGVCSPAKIDLVRSLGAATRPRLHPRRLGRRQPPLRPGPRHRGQTRRSPGCAVPSPPTALPCSSAARTAATSPVG